MSTSLLLAIFLAHAAAPDTVPLPPVDSAWGEPGIVEVRGVESTPDSVTVWLLIDAWGRVDSARAVSVNEKVREAVEAAARQIRFTAPESAPAWGRIVLATRPSGQTQSPPRGGWLPPAELAPVFTAYVRRPEIADRGHALNLLEWNYPEELKSKGIGGIATIWVFVDEEGVPRNVRRQKSSGIRLLDEAAERSALEFRFTPAINDGQPVPVWIAIPITFSSTGGAETYTGVPGNREFELGPAAYPVGDAILNRPFDVLPELIHPDLVQARLTATYLQAEPEDHLGLRIQFDLDEDGRVTDADVDDWRPKGMRQKALEKRILAAFEESRFRPAMHEGERVAARSSTWLIFHREHGLLPSVEPDRCHADLSLRDGPRFTPTEQRPALITPTWERARIISETWPIALQKGSHEFRMWLLIDQHGRVCDARFLQRPDDRWTASKVIHIARRLRYAPGMRAGEPVAVWHQDVLAFEF